MNGFVEMQPKGSSSVVVAVPVCRPARPARAHPSLVVPSGLVETCCLHVESCHFGMETPLRGRSGGHTGTAPTIPNTCKQAASLKLKGFLLAGTLRAFEKVE